MSRTSEFGEESFLESYNTADFVELFRDRTNLLQDEYTLQEDAFFDGIDINDLINFKSTRSNTNGSQETIFTQSDATRGRNSSETEEQSSHAILETKKISDNQQNLCEQTDKSVRESEIIDAISISPENIIRGRDRYSTGSDSEEYNVPYQSNKKFKRDIGRSRYSGCDSPTNSGCGSVQSVQTDDDPRNNLGLHRVSSNGTLSPGFRMGADGQGFERNVRQYSEGKSTIDANGLSETEHVFTTRPENVDGIRETVRSNGQIDIQTWIQKIKNSTVKERIVHDIVDARKDNIYAFVLQKIRELKRANGFYFIVEHNLINFRHFHIIHNCNYSNGCRCTFLQNLPIKRRGRNSTKVLYDLDNDYIKNLFEYLLQGGYEIRKAILGSSIWTISNQNTSNRHEEDGRKKRAASALLEELGDFCELPDRQLRYPTINPDSIHHFRKGYV